MPSFEFSSTLRQQLKEGAPVVALTGAGVSAESGLATFRGPGGLWEGRDPASLATPEAFSADPELVWRFYAWRRRQAAAARPNPAHRALAALERKLPRFDLITQNVDGLHERAGNRDVVRLHGSIWRLRCTREGTETDDDRGDFDDMPPRCRCGALLRPGVVWFGESLPADGLTRALASMETAATVLIAGTSGMVHPAAGLPAVAAQAGAWIVEINPEATPLSAISHETLRGPAGEILPLIAGLAGAAMESP